tara:strand:- start:1723 stop:1986 length:264 start_codon:yes stop_codon:yes gene_type:complete
MKDTITDKREIAQEYLTTLTELAHKEPDEIFCGTQYFRIAIVLSNLQNLVDNSDTISDFEFGRIIGLAEFTMAMRQIIEVDYSWQVQ